MQYTQRKGQQILRPQHFQTSFVNVHLCIHMKYKYLKLSFSPTIRIVYIRISYLEGRSNRDHINLRNSSLISFSIFRENGNRWCFFAHYLSRFFKFYW